MKHPGVYLLTILTIALLISAVSCSQKAATPTPAPTLQPGDSTRTLTVDGLSRDYILHIPPSINRVNPVPAVFAFHDLLSTPTELKNTAQLDRLADSNGFIIIYPQGIDKSWNAGNCCGNASENNVDEIAFVRQMLVDLDTIVKIDPKRIYATGFANGAMMAYRLACEMSETFAAIAPMTGLLWYSPCQPGQPVSVLHVHGLANETIPYSGGRSDCEGVLPEPLGGWDFPSVEQGISTWVQLDGCNGSPKEEKQDEVTYITYDSCQAGTTVELVTIEGVGHWWPNTSWSPVDSNLIWEFFAAHPK
jgi:polyhydroxybutyrate depolymerase